MPCVGAAVAGKLEAIDQFGRSVRLPDRERCRSFHIVMDEFDKRSIGQHARDGRERLCGHGDMVQHVLGARQASRQAGALGVTPATLALSA
jgi:hypothetical protein